MHKSYTPLQLAESLFWAVQTSPFRFTTFARRYDAASMSLTEGSCRLRDLLPLPLPSLEPVFRWQDYTGHSPKVTKRFRSAAHLTLWQWLIIFGLNYEYCGRLADNWRTHRRICTADPSHQQHVCIREICCQTFSGHIEATRLGGGSPSTE